MDNYIKHLIDKIPCIKEIIDDGNSCQIKIIIKKFENTSKHLQNLGDIYRIAGEIVLYLEKNRKVIVEYTIDEIKILY